MSNFKLYEISSLLSDAIRAGFATADPDTGELPDDWARFLDDCQMERDCKALDVVRYIKGRTAEAEAIRAEEINLADRRRSAEREAERLKNYLATWIPAGEKLADATAAISWRVSTTVEVIESAVAGLPPKFQKVHVAPDKIEIGKALKLGNELPGCSLVKHQNIVLK